MKKHNLTEKEVNVDELLAKVEMLEKEKENLLFDFEFEQAKQAKRQLTIVINHSHNVNAFLHKKEIDVKHDSVKDIVRKSVFRSYSFSQIVDLLHNAYSVKEDRSKSQKENKSTDSRNYAVNRAHKILNDILKEQFALDKFKVQMTSKQYEKMFA